MNWSDSEDWERVFAVGFWGVYHCARTFLPLLIKSPEGILVHASSVNGFWASLGPGVPHTAYSTAKFAVRGFSEALIEDLRTSAPHVRVVLVMPGHVATGILDGIRSGAWRILVGWDAQALVRSLTSALLAAGGDPRFEVADVTPGELDSERPWSATSTRPGSRTRSSATSWPAATATAGSARPVSRRRVRVTVGGGGTFRERIMRARLERMLSAETAARCYQEMFTGLG